MPDTDNTGASGESATSVVSIQRELVYALLRPAIRLSTIFQLPMGTVEELCRLAYYEEIRHHGNNSQRTAAKKLGKSLRTIGALERQLKGDFLAATEDLALLRRIEDKLEHGPQTLEELIEGLRDTESASEHIGEAVELLVNVGRLERTRHDGEPRVALNHSFISLVSGDLRTRIDGLNHQLEVISAAVQARFLAPWRPAVARTLAFVARRQDIEALGESLVGATREQCTEAEEDALKDGKYERFALTMALTPMEPEQKED